jgi:TolB-like protein/Tfp pilus assembly protein PilF
VAAAVAVAVAALVVWPKKNDSAPQSNAGAGTHPPRAEQSAAPRSEAQKLAAQAEELIADSFNSTRENYQLADELCRKALAADAGDAEIWALAARISFDQIFRSYDMSDHRLELAREQAQRALKLDPNSINAGLAVATYHRWRANRDEAERMQRDLMSREPTNRRVLRLGAELARLRQNDAGVADYLARLQALPGGDPVSLFTEAHNLINSGRYVEAGALLDRVIAKNPGRMPCYEKFYLLVRGWADYEGARKFLTQIPAQFLDEDSFVAMAARMWILLGDGDAALAALQRVPREFLEEFGNSEPKGYAAGWAQKIAGRSAAATLEWQQALAQVETRLAADPKNLALLERKAQLQASLGQKSDALATMRLCVEMGGQRTWSRGIWQAEVLAMTGEAEPAVAILAAQWPTLPFHLRSYLRGDLAHAPQFAAIRDDPRVRRLIAEHSAALEEMKGVSRSIPAKAEDKPALADKSVAVLAFADLSAAHDSEYFSDGISEELLNVLAKIPGLKVSARTSSFHFKGKDTPIPEIARQLGVAYVIEGSVRKSGGKVRITAQLIKAADGFHVWSDNFDRELKDIFAVQDEIAGLIAKNLSLKLGTSSAAAPVALNPQAFELYVQGRREWNLRSAEGFTRAEKLFNHALELAPDFARAQAALADVAMLRGEYSGRIGAFGQRNAPEVKGLIAQIGRVLALDPESAEAHASLGNAFTFAWNYDDAERELRRAVALNPNYATGHQWLAYPLFFSGQIDDALSELKLAVELDPLSPRILDNYGHALRRAGRNREAIAVFDRALALQPSWTEALAGKALAFVALGRTAEAVALARHLPMGEGGESTVVGFQILIFGQSGLRAEAEALLARPDATGKWSKTHLLLAVGRREEALAALDAPAEFFDPEHTDVFSDPLYDTIRDDPRFAKFLATLGRTEAHARAQAWRMAHPPEKPEGTK